MGYSPVAATAYAAGTWRWTEFDHSPGPWTDYNTGASGVDTDCEPAGTGTGCLQPDYQCAEFVARCIAAGGAIDGLSETDPQAAYGTYTFGGRPYDLLWVRYYPDAPHAGLYDYLQATGMWASLPGTPPALAAAMQPGDICFYEGDASIGQFGHVCLCIASGTPGVVAAHNTSQSGLPNDGYSPAAEPLAVMRWAAGGSPPPPGPITPYAAPCMLSAIDGVLRGMAWQVVVPQLLAPLATSPVWVAPAAPEDIGGTHDWDRTWHATVERQVGRLHLHAVDFWALQAFAISGNEIGGVGYGQVVGSTFAVASDPAGIHVIAGPARAMLVPLPNYVVAFNTWGAIEGVAYVGRPWILSEISRPYDRWYDEPARETVCGAMWPQGRDVDADTAWAAMVSGGAPGYMAAWVCGVGDAPLSPAPVGGNMRYTRRKG